jgi:AraC-like DNA-binding protein
MPPFSYYKWRFSIFCLVNIEVRMIIHQAYRAVCASDWSWDSRISPFKGYNLWLVASGRGRVATGEEIFTVKGGDCFLHRSSEQQWAEHDPDDPFTVPFVTFELSAQGTASFPRHHQLTHPAFMEEILNRVIQSHQAGNRAGATAWLEVALREFRPVSSSEPEGVDGGDVEMRRMAAGIHSGQRFQVRVEELAFEAGCSVDHFIRRFRKAMGVTPGEFLIRCRTEEAKALLSSSSYAIGRIAELLHYPDIYAFSRQFKARSGLSPTAYRLGR